MAYNYFPATYQPIYPVQGTQMSYQQNQQNSIVWVQGEAGAKSYLVAPNTTVQLWDSEDQVIYLKSADASGMPSIKTLDYTIRETGQKGANKAVKAVDGGNVEYATKDDLRAVSERIRAIQSKVDDLCGREIEA